MTVCIDFIPDFYWLNLLLNFLLIYLGLGVISNFYTYGFTYPISFVLTPFVELFRCKMSIWDVLWTEIYLVLILLMWPVNHMETEWDD